MMPTLAASYSPELKFVAPGMGGMQQKRSALSKALSAAAANSDGSSAAASASLLVS